jgi:hypothetical protein
MDMSDGTSAPVPGPPPAICSDRVLLYALLDDFVGFHRGHGLFFVDGKEIGPVPCLAICQHKGSPGFVLYYCGRDWEMLGVATSYDSIEAVKRRAERIYPGSASCWVEAHFSEEDVTAYLNEVWADEICSFCRKRPDETMATIFEGSGAARICGNCVRELCLGLDQSPRSEK